MMGVIRARTRKDCHLPREYGPVTWYHAPLDLNGKQFMFSWSKDQLRKVICASLRASHRVNLKYVFKFIQVPNRYWKEPVGYPRARPKARGLEHLNHQIQRHYGKEM